MYQAKRLGRDRVAAYSGARAPETASEADGDDAPAAAPVSGLVQARERLAASRADLLAFVAGEVATRLGLSGQAVAEVAVQARERALAGRRARRGAPAAPRQVAGELGDRVVAAVVAARDVLADKGHDGRLRSGDVHRPRAARVAADDRTRRPRGAGRRRPGGARPRVAEPRAGPGPGPRAVVPGPASDLA